MKKYTAKTVFALSTLMFAGLAAAESTPDISTDLIYGNASVKASVSDGFVVSDSATSDLSTDLMYGGVEQSASPSSAPELISGVHDLSTDILYGS